MEVIFTSSRERPFSLGAWSAAGYGGRQIIWELEICEWSLKTLSGASCPDMEPFLNQHDETERGTSALTIASFTFEACSLWYT